MIIDTRNSVRNRWMCGAITPPDCVRTQFNVPSLLMRTMLPTGIRLYELIAPPKGRRIARAAVYRDGRPNRDGLIRLGMCGGRRPGTSSTSS
jgi:hypothetical protein